MLKDESKINEFKRDHTNKNQPTLTFETNDSSHEPETNPIEEKPQKIIKRIFTKKVKQYFKKEKKTQVSSSTPSKANLISKTYNP